MVSILCSTSRSTFYLMALEVLMINKRKPSLNTKDEYISKNIAMEHNLSQEQWSKIDPLVLQGHFICSTQQYIFQIGRQK